MTFLPDFPFHLNALFFIGFLLVCGTLGGFVAHKLQWLPSITGFMLVGLIAGPNVLGIFDHAALEGAKVIVDIALALILYRLGLSLDIKALRSDRSLLLVSAVESAATFVATYAALTWLDVSPLASAVVAALAVSSSPAVLLHVSHELGADGPMVQKAQALVALNNVFAFLLFSMLMPLMYHQTEAPLSTILVAPLYQLTGSALLGLGLGWMLHKIALLTRSAHQYSLALVVGAVSMTLGLALSLKLSTLFAPLVLGMVVRGVERKHLIADMQWGPAFELFFIALFVYAGANLHLHEMWTFAAAALAFALSRAVAKFVGVAATAWVLKWPRTQVLNTGLTLWPMAGMAIGLANAVVTSFPELGSDVAAIVLAGVAIFETIGPPVVARALRWAGEVPGGPAPLDESLAGVDARTAETQAPTTSEHRI